MFIDIRDKLKELGIAPIFFVGSGISRRYLDSPNWQGLLKEIINETEINFEKCKQKRTNKGQINLEELAEDLEEYYFDNLPESELEENGSRAYYFRKRICDIMNTYLENKVKDLEDVNEIKELRKTNPAVIITTNYDELLEKVFGYEYTVHIGQDSLLTNVLDGVGEIYKIHGSVTDPESIVITKNDYDTFFEKDIYLNSKLLTLFLEYPIVFLGYSISDRNVKSILTTIVKMLPEDKVNELKKRMWFVTKAEKEDKVKIKRINLDDGLYIEVNSYELNDFTKFYESINDITIKKLPIKFLKYLKNNTYKLIASQEYNPKFLNVNLSDIEKIDNFNNGNNFVGITFSNVEKKVNFKRGEICKAFLYDEIEGYDPYSILSFRNSNSNKVPFFKFIKHLKYDDILKYLENNSKVYNLINEDDTNYKKDIGVNLNVDDYCGGVSDNNISEYSDEYIKKFGIMKNRRNSIKRWILLKLLKENLDDLINNKNFCENNHIELAKCITNLEEAYIEDNKEKIEKILKIISNEKEDLEEVRNVLCLIDKVFYKKEILRVKNIN